MVLVCCFFDSLFTQLLLLWPFIRISLYWDHFGAWPLPPLLTLVEILWSGKPHTLSWLIFHLNLWATVCQTESCKGPTSKYPYVSLSPKTFYEKGIVLWQRERVAEKYLSHKVSWLEDEYRRSRLQSLCEVLTEGQFVRWLCSGIKFVHPLFPGQAQESDWGSSFLK